MEPVATKKSVEKLPLPSKLKKFLEEPPDTTGRINHSDFWMSITVLTAFLRLHFSQQSNLIVERLSSWELTVRGSLPSSK